MWIGSERGYPDLGADAETIQSEALECRVETAEGTMHRVSFILDSPRFGKGYHVVALWRVSRRVWLQAAGQSRGGTGQAELIAALETVRYQVTPTH
jgi:hypothetical protein